MTPKTECKLPSLRFVTSPGMMVWYGLFRGASTFGWLESRLKLAPRFCRVKPQPRGMMAVPKPMIVAVDEADGVTRRVRHADIHRVAAPEAPGWGTDPHA